jgi:transcription-repair coupling factor (superfamily II helicase)
LVSELVPLLEYLPSSTVIWANDLEHVIAALNNEFSEAEEAYAKLSLDSIQRKPEILYTDGAHFQKQANDLSIIEFGLKNFLKKSEKIDFQVNPQPAFNKDFSRLQATLIEHKEAGFECAIIAENPGQVSSTRTRRRSSLQTIKSLSDSIDLKFEVGINEERKHSL